ncbi:MAG: type IV secretion system DNA-binding domain-containing protein [Pseudomonadota bacterium]
MKLPEKNGIVYLGETSFRNQNVRFGIKTDDRRRHMYVVGSTGMGKSEFLKNMAIQDIEAGRGICFIDPHGDAANDLLDFIPEERVKDVIYFNPDDLEYPIAFNVMEGIGFDYRHLVASGLVGVFKKIWGVEAWSGRMEYILNNTILALLEYPDSTLLGINRLMASKEYRKKVVANITDPIVKAFWTDEFAKYADKFATEATAAIQNKVGQFASNNLIRNILGQVKSKIDIRKIMDEGKILIVNVSRGKIGEDASRLLGAFLVTKIQLAAMSRVNVPESERRDFYLYVDEFQHFATESFANILSEARKYHLSLIMAHQYIKQMEEPVMEAVFGNVGTIVTFRVGAEDAEFLEKWFQPDFMMNDIVNLGKFTIYLKLMINGISSRGFSAATIPPFPKLEKSNREAIIAYSREKYSTPRDVVQKEIADWAGPIAEEPARQERREDHRSQRGGETRQGGQSRAPRREEKFHKPKEVSLNTLSGDLPSQGAVDFRGRKIQEKSLTGQVKDKNLATPVRVGGQIEREKKEIDTSELKKILEKALKKKK